MPNIKLVSALFLTALLAACGGGSGKPLFGDQAGDQSNGDSDGKPLKANTFYPLDIYEQGKEYVEEDAYRSLIFDEYVFSHMIAPVDAKTLKPAANPSIDDYGLTINEEDVTKDEHGLIMQKVIGLPVQLQTALVIDMSPSNEVDIQSFIAAVKQYITTAQASSDPVIKKQEFTILGFASDLEWYVEDFTSDTTILNAGLDQLKIDWEGQALGNFSALYQSIIAAVGTYKGEGAASIPEVDYSLDGDNDLKEGYRVDASGKQLGQLTLGNVVVFGSGGDTLTYFSYDDALAALNWQSYLVYDEEVKDDGSAGDTSTDSDGDSANAGKVDGMLLAGKPLYYVSLGNDSALKKISNLATQVIEAGSSAELNFSAALIEHQQGDVKLRSRLDNLYMVRYAVPQRVGTFNIEFSSNAEARSHVLSAEIKLDAPLPIPEPEAALEIAGPNNSYLAGGQVSLSNVSTLHPAIRWDARSVYSLNDSVWSVGGVTRETDSNGTITITADDIGKTVLLSNGALPSATINIVK